MSLPIIIFLGFFLFISLFFVVFAIFNVFHAIRYGIASAFNTITIAVFIIGSVLLILSALGFASSVDWSQAIEIGTIF